MIQAKEKELPADWVQSPLGELIKLEYGKALTTSLRDKNGDVPVYGSSGNVGKHNEAYVKEPSIIVGRKGNVGHIFISQNPCWPIDTVYFIKPPQNIDIKYLYYHLQNLNLAKLDKSTAIPGLNRNDAYKVLFNLAPLHQQKRIVAKIEELFSHIDAGIAGLKKTQTLLKQYRQSVLKAAVTGELTKQWREENKDKRLDKKKFQEIIQLSFLSKKRVEQERILKYRNSEWFYDCEDQIPSEWMQANLIDVTNVITCGVAKKPDYVDEGIPFLSAQNSKPFSPNLRGIKFISEKDFKTFTVGAKPEEGDVLYSRVGANFGEACVIPWKFDFAIYVSLTLIKQNRSILDGKYLALFLNLEVRSWVAAFKI